MTPKRRLITLTVLRFIVQIITGCGGYTIHLWSLGFQACQMQLNIYGPGGFEKVYQLPRRTGIKDRLMQAAWSSLVRRRN